MLNIGEQRLADQSGVIRTNELLSKVELKEIQGEVEKETQPEEVNNATEDRHRSDEVEIEDEIEGNGEGILEEVELIEISEMASREDNPDRKTVLEQLKEEMKRNDNPLSLRNGERKRLKAVVAEVDSAVKDIPTRNLTETNRLLVAAVHLTTSKLDVKKKEVRMLTEPAWRRRLNGKIAKLRKDVSRLEKWKTQGLRNNDLKEHLERTYDVK